MDKKQIIALKIKQQLAPLNTIQVISISDKSQLLIKPLDRSCEVRVRIGKRKLFISARRKEERGFPLASTQEAAQYVQKQEQDLRCLTNILQLLMPLAEHY